MAGEAGSQVAELFRLAWHLLGTNLGTSLGIAELRNSRCATPARAPEDNKGFHV